MENMLPEKILDIFHQQRDIPPQVLDAIEQDAILRSALVRYFQHNKDREFALQLLDKMIILRSDSGLVPGDDLMLACYLLGQHGDVADCLKIWQAKTIDFDTFCYIDIQLLAFAGISETITFLQQQHTEEARKALDYLLACREAGDLDDLDTYFSKEELPWWI